MDDKEIYEYLTPKMKLIYFCVDENKIIQNDPLFMLTFSIEDIRSILELDNAEIIKYLYLNRESIDKALLGSEKEDEIPIKFDMLKNGFHNYFYLDLIISYNPDIMNYKFDKQFIKQIYNNIKKKKKNKFTQIMMSKIINDLINYYKLTEYYDEFKDSEELNEFQNGISEIIEENITIFKALKLDLTKVDILEKKINILYKEIIISLIKLKFNDNTIDIFNQLDLENVILNKSIVDELWETLNSQDFKDYFSINGLNDLFNSQKINFFYIIFKYIFKSDFYAIKEELFEFRKMIVSIFSNDKNKEIFLSEYNKLNYCLKKQIFFIIKSFLTIYCTKFYKIFFLMTIKDKDPYLLLDNSYLKYSINIKKEDESPFDNFEFTILKEKYPDIPKYLKDSVPELLNFMNDFKEKIEKKYNNNYKLIITLKLNIVGDLKDIVGKPYNINCVYELEKLGLDSDENKVKKYKDENILVNGLSEGFEFLIEEINDKSYNKKNNNN